MDQQTNQPTPNIHSNCQSQIPYTLRGYPVQTQVIVAPQTSAVYATVPQIMGGYQHNHQQKLQQFWSQQMFEIEQASDFKNHQLPLTRIKKIMKANEDVRMISAEAPVLFAKACEMFILELTMRSWMLTEENRRRTLQKNDIAAAITRNDIFDFLVDVIPRDEVKEEGVGMPRGMYYMTQPCPQGIAPPVSSPAIIVGRPVMAIDASMYATGASYTTQFGVSQVWQQQSQETKPEGS